MLTKAIRLQRITIAWQIYYLWTLTDQCPRMQKYRILYKKSGIRIVLNAETRSLRSGFPIRNIRLRMV